MITATETQKIFSDYGVDLTQVEINEMTADANQNEQSDHRGLTAHQWVVRWAKEFCHENMDSSSFSERLEYDFSQN